MNRLFLGDCIDVMKNELSENSVDLIITDPPFGVNFKDNKHYNDDYDYVSESIDVWFDLMHKVLKPNRHIYVFIPTVIAEIWQAAFKRHFKYLNILVFPLHHPQRFDPRNFRFDAQFVLYGAKLDPDGSYSDIRELNKVNYQRKSKQWINDKRNRDKDNEYSYWYSSIFSNEFRANYRNNAVKKTLHPSEKNKKVIELLIKLSSDPDEVVLDPFMGSGVVPASAKKLGRKYIGIEIDPKWYGIAFERVKNTPKFKRLTAFS